MAKTCQYKSCMSLAELKSELAKLSPGDRLVLAAFLAELEEADEPAFRTRVDKRMQAMDAGQKVSMAEFEKRHEDLKARGQ